MNKDNDAIERIKSNQNRIQSINKFTDDEKQMFNNPSMTNKYIEEEEGASGEARGTGYTDKKGMMGLGLIKNIKKLKIAITVALIAVLVLGVIVVATIFTNEDFKGYYLTDNVNDSTTNNSGSTSSPFATATGTKKVNAVVSEYYKSVTTKNNVFFSSLKEIANNYNNYSLQNGLSLVDGEFDIAMIASAIHYNKFISDAVVISGAINGYQTLSNMGVARSRGMTSLPQYEIKSFYELADISLGTDLGIPITQLRGLTGNLVGSRVVSACVSDTTGYLSNAAFYSDREEVDQAENALFSTIVRYETLYYSGAPMIKYADDGSIIITWYTEQLLQRLSDLKSQGVFDDYYDTSLYNPNMDCGSNHLVHYVEKYMNYKTFAKYLLNEYIPENYIECVDCGSANKRADVVEIATSIFDSRNEFAGLYYDDVIDTINFSNGDSLTTSESQYQLPDDVKNNFISPFNINAKCSITDQFTSNRAGYSHFAVDAYASDRNLVAVYDGVVITVVNNVPNIYSQWNGGACVDSSGNMDSRSNGNYVVIEHTLNGQTYHSYYMHMETINVNPGDKVTKGQIIGTEGNTGCSSGYHLHYQLISGSKRYDPTLLFAQCDGAQIISYSSKTLKEYLYSIYPNYTFTNIDECIVKVYDYEGASTYTTLDLESYVAGVVTHEMPRNYNFEAIKAQAIAARNMYIKRTNYCTIDEITINSEEFQTFSKIDVYENRSDIVSMLSARETAGMIISYSHGQILTEYSSFPCEKVYTCTDPDKYVNDELYAHYEPYYQEESGTITCVDTMGHLPDQPNKVSTGKNANAGTVADQRCGGRGVFYYCGSTAVPRQFRKQKGLEDTVGDCGTISYDILPHGNAGSTFRSIPVEVDLIKEGDIDIGHTDNPKDDYSNFYGHNRGMSQVLADIYADKFGWNYIQIIHYFYDSEETSPYDLINIETPVVLLDNQTEYEANYADCCTAIVTIPVNAGLSITVPVDFYVAGSLYYNYGTNVSNSLLQALAIANRTWAMNKSEWGTKKLQTDGQYYYTYTDNKKIYDAVNSVKEEFLVDEEGYIISSGHYDIGKDGTINGSGNNQTITYELGYLYNSGTHKVMIPYNGEEEGVAGNVGIVYNVASYLANNWYFVDGYEILKFFYGEENNIIDLRSMTTIGAVKDENGEILGEGTSFDSLSNVLNSSLEQYVSTNGKGTLEGVLAAAYWLYYHSNEVGDVLLPYQLGGEYQKIGVNPNWGQLENDGTKTGLDCMGFIRWAFINGYFEFPSDYGSTLFYYNLMNEYIESKNLQCGDGESCHIEFDKDSDGKPIKGVSLEKYLNGEMIQKGDILYHPSGITYSGEDSSQNYAHIAIVYDVDLKNGTITIIHSSGGDPGIRYSVIDAKSGTYESGAQHSYTDVIRLSEMEKRGYLS